MWSVLTVRLFLNGPNLTILRFLLMASSVGFALSEAQDIHNQLFLIIAKMGKKSSHENPYWGISRKVLQFKDVII